MTDVTLFTESFRIGGAEKALLTLLRNIDKERFNVHVICMCRTGELLDQYLNVPGIDIRFILDPRKGLVNSLKSKFLYKILPSRLSYRLWCRKHSDIEIAFCEGFTTRLLSRSTNSKAKRLAWVHTDLAGNDWPVRQRIFRDRRQEAKAYSKFNTVVCVSENVRQGLVNEFGTEHSITAYNPIDAEEIRGGCKSSHPLPADAINIVSIGRLEWLKGYDVLIDAFRHLKSERRILLHIVGDGSEFEALKRQIDTYGAADRIFLHGIQHNPYPYLNGADIYVCPSRKEGFNIAIIEAMSLAVPVVATRSAGPEEIIDDNEYGIICDEAALSEKIQYLIDHEPERKRLSEMAAVRAGHFALDRSMSVIHRLFEPT